jgi:hypothetical protein
MNLAGRVDTRLKCVRDWNFLVGHLGEVGESMFNRCREGLVTLGTRALKRGCIPVPAYTLPYVLSLPLIGYAAPLRSFACTANR